ncbi:hypothetical protein TPHA_0J01670 [Tetrapisispora phaffii CBS 4417]|uniref:Nucleolar complex protein 14 n=1 Tax=Tetrapisispora phaffii (strain ATCC 24235 / CBS 4417 / NBRC 1672 / NRRL Y-8282 / UCD 70-5) TaxID=1071381 RepID=G8BYP6_TETPH|nr:hypothetical protein TPHA_0J01670 [Tetrapisispora phaffii CBS 4417]CCE64988.1 hypothetical protein TPHA_0J01670 [Tetrapisispora phaffii CBS 4417]
MAGSQLKNLKATLKAHGLTGQTNIKKNKKNTKRKAREYDREERAKVIAKIREDFNPFEVKTTKTKKKNAEKAHHLVAVGKPGISKQIGEDQRKVAYEARNSQKNRRGGLVDRRFGESNKNITEEERMLERFTREKQSQSRKNKQKLFNLEDNEDSNDIFGDVSTDMFGNQLTHLGQSLANDDGDFAEGDLGGFSKRGYEEDGLGEPSGPVKKKTKAEVMKEIISKSKFYKGERQKAQMKMEEQIDDLDDNFDDIFSELKSSEKAVKKEAIVPKEAVDKDYDIKVKELLLEKRAAPAERTKTEEEIKKEADEHKKKLEQQRLARMQGILEDEDGREQGVEDLDDNFWGEGSDEEESGNEIADSDDDVKFDSDDEEGDSNIKNTHDDGNEPRFGKKVKDVPCPESQDELIEYLKKIPFPEQPQAIKKVIQQYQPKLAEGNKEKMGVFTGLILRYILFLSNQNYTKNINEFRELQKSLVSILHKMAAKYNHSLSQCCRDIIYEIQEKFKSSHSVQISDLIFFSIVGMIFSTSDQYHLVVTPSTILMSEILEQLKFNSIDRLMYGSVLCRILLKYQRLSKRYFPEMLYFYEKALVTLLNDDGLAFNDAIKSIRRDSYSLAIGKDADFTGFENRTIHLHEIINLSNNSGSADDNIEHKKMLLLNNIFKLVDDSVTVIWKSLPSFNEITQSIHSIVELYKQNVPSLEARCETLLNQMDRVKNNNKQIPLTLQNHKPVSIPSRTPKFEENYNPEKKSYDPDRTRQEINKVKAQLKKERKFTMKEIRKDSRFEARQRIEKQKKESDEYRSKMSHIINTINTEEGAEKNKYEREKRLRGSK